MLLQEILNLEPGTLIKGVEIKKALGSYNYFYPNLNGWFSNGFSDRIIPASLISNPKFNENDFECADKLNNQIHDLRANWSKFTKDYFQTSLYSIDKEKIVGMSLGKSILLLEICSTLGRSASNILSLYCLHKILSDKKVSWLILENRVTINFYQPVLEDKIYKTKMRFF